VIKLNPELLQKIFDEPEGYLQDKMIGDYITLGIDQAAVKEASKIEGNQSAFEAGFKPGASWGAKREADRIHDWPAVFDSVECVTKLTARMEELAKDQLDHDRPFFRDGFKAGAWWGMEFILVLKREVDWRLDLQDAKNSGQKMPDSTQKGRP